MKDELLRELEKDFQDKRISQEQYESIKNEIIDKAEQLEKLVADHNAGQISDDEFFQWSQDISEDFRKIGMERRGLVEENIDFRKKHTEGKFNKIVLMIFCGIIMMAGGIWFVNYSYEHRSIKDVPEPIQVDFDGEEREKEYFVDGKSLGLSDYYMRMNYIASYDIKGLVVVTRHYDGDIAWNKAFPVDLGLAWGDYAANRAVMECTEGYHKMTCNYNMDKMTEAGLVRREVVNLVSNNHLSPADKDIYDKLMRVRSGDYVEIKGYLIKVAVSDTDDYANPFEAVSSTSRKDHMSGVFDTTNTGCEVIYVTSVEWLD